MPSEAEVFLNRLNAISLSQLRLPANAGCQPSIPVDVGYLKERIRAVRHENRDLRETLEKTDKDVHALRQELDQAHQENRNLKEEAARLLEQAVRYERLWLVAQRQLEEAQASLSWRLAHRAHQIGQYLRPRGREIGPSMNKAQANADP